MAVEIHDPKGFGRIRLQQVRDSSGGSVIPFVQDVFDSGATVRTDESAAYLGLKVMGYGHERKVMLGAGDAAHVSMPGVHQVASLVKRWILGTQQGRSASPTRLLSGRVHLSL